MESYQWAWQDIAEARGVRLRSSGTGKPLIVVPGMEGDGTSCLHVVSQVISDIGGARELRVILVDYSAERHDGIAELEATVMDLVRAAVTEPAYVWGQSFGCLLAAILAKNLPTEHLILVSPFTRLPWSRQSASWLIRWTPRPVYRATSKPICRWVFGPDGADPNHPFFTSLQNVDPRDISRRSGWLRGENQLERFAAVAEAAQAWFGAEDRLIALRQQTSLFMRLSPKPGFPRTIPEAGHVVLPRASVEFLSEDVASILVGDPK